MFVYGELLPGEREAHWLAGLPSRPAWVRGQLWRSPRGRRALVCGGGSERVYGNLVEVESGREKVLDLLLGDVPRRRVGAAIGLLPVTATTWCFPDARAAELAGYRRPRR